MCSLHSNWCRMSRDPATTEVSHGQFKLPLPTLPDAGCFYFDRRHRKPKSSKTNRTSQSIHRDPVASYEPLSREVKSGKHEPTIQAPPRPPSLNNTSPSAGSVIPRTPKSTSLLERQSTYELAEQVGLSHGITGHKMWSNNACPSHRSLKLTIHH